MKKIFKKIAVFLGIIAITSTITSLTCHNSVSAADFLGMPPWNDGVDLDGINSEGQLVGAVAIIATNILKDFTVAAGYLLLGYAIWGGYLYMFSSGDPGKAANGKKALIHAFTGICIVICAYTIFGTIRIALAGNSDISSCTTGCVEPSEMVSSLVGWVGGIAGAVCALFILIGAWGYITASGDANKLQKAKNTLIYAIIGLLLVAFAEVLTAFITSTIRNSNGQSSLDTNVSININKEQNELI